MSDIDIMIALSKFDNQENPSAKDDELCMYCGSSQSPLQDQQEWIECESCKRWIHQACDYIFNPEKCLQIQYVCPCCRYVNCLPHPCNGDEQLGIDPRFAVLDNKKSKKTSKKAKHESETDEETVATQYSKRQQQTQQQPQETPAPKAEVPNFTQNELLQLNVLVEEKAQDQARRKNQGADTQSQLNNFLNQAFNHTRVPSSRIFKNLQQQCREPQTFKDVNIAADDVSFCTMLALFYRQQQEQLQNANENAPKVLGLEREKRITSLTQMHMSKMMQQVQTREYLQELLPVLPRDSDLRARAALCVFDSVLESIERQRFRYLKTLIPQAVEACYFYQNQHDLTANYFLQKSKQILKMDFDQIDLTYKSYLEPELLLAAALGEGAPELISPRQWVDLSKRGVKAFKGLGLVRATFLHAIVNVSLGLNVYDKPLGEQITDHIIHFGIVSARRFFERQIYCQANQIEAGCIFQVAQKCKHEGCECGIDNGLIGQVDMISSDQKIQDWDILETPTSVVWALKMVEIILAECGNI